MCDELEKTAPEVEQPAEEDLDGLLRRINDQRDGLELNEVLYKIKSDIGRDDFRAFIYHSVFFKHSWMLPLYIIVPPAISLIAGIFGGQSFQMGLIFTAIMYVLIFGMTIFRTERGLSKRDKENPKETRITPTTFTFYDNVILNSKKTGDVRVPYQMLTKACRTKKHFILYFDNKKAMVIRLEDAVRDTEIEAFTQFIKSKVNQ